MTNGDSETLIALCFRILSSNFELKEKKKRKEKRGKISSISIWCQNFVYRLLSCHNEITGIAYLWGLFHCIYFVLVGFCISGHVRVSFSMAGVSGKFYNRKLWRFEREDRKLWCFAPFSLCLFPQDLPWEWLIVNCKLSLPFGIWVIYRVGYTAGGNIVSKQLVLAQETNQ